MIPDHLIEKAKAAYINRCGKTCSHDSLTAALEAVAADIWGQGFEEGRDHGYDFRMAENWDDEYPPEPANPYRASETA